MQIRLEQLEQGTLNMEFEEPSETFPVLAEMSDGGACQFIGPVTTTLSAEKFGAMVEVTGHVTARARLSCGRCLQEFETPLASHFTLTYQQGEPHTDIGDPGQQELELTAEDMGLIYFQGDAINLKNEIQAQVVLAFPIRALCKPNCRGMCSKCGADLNTAECGCDRSPPDGQFAALKDLKL